MGLQQVGCSTRHGKGLLRGPFFFVAVALSCLSLTAAARSEVYAVYFDNGEAGRIDVGELRVARPGGRFEFVLNGEAFGDYFLSMRPFQCVEHAGSMLCYLPYPYENRRILEERDLTDLEYDLLFIARTPTEYGIDPWNGRYFRLRREGESMVGTLYETDLNVLAAPPDDGSLRPLADADMVKLVPGGSQWVPRLRIEPR